MAVKRPITCLWISSRDCEKSRIKKLSFACRFEQRCASTGNKNLWHQLHQGQTWQAGHNFKMSQSRNWIVSPFQSEWNHNSYPRNSLYMTSGGELADASRKKIALPPRPGRCTQVFNLDDDKTKRCNVMTSSYGRALVT